MITNRLLVITILAGFLELTTQRSALAGEQWPRHEFTRMIAHLGGSYGDDGYLDFIDAARPEQCQMGFYGAHFWSLAHTPQYKGYPSSFPVQGLKECGDWFEKRNKEIHDRKILVVGSFNVEFLVGDPDGPEGPRGFFKFYRDLWDEAELGPKPPVEDPIDFLEKDKDGNPMPQNSYNIGGMKEYFACLRNPHWRTVLKAWMKRGIERGADGFIANYFYRHDCHCQYCQKDFRDYLKGRFQPAEMKQKLGIADLDKHVFDEIVCWHKPEESTPLRREMLRWSQISNKEAFDEVFIEHGRSIKPSLIVGQWNHLSNFSQINGDERCLLPAELWGKGEDYLWYSLGASGVYTDLKKGDFADGTLQARYIRGAFDDKPFTLGKYEGVRTRTAIAELAANGGAPMGLYARISDPEAKAVFAQYFGFMERNDRIYHANTSNAEIAILYPRKAVHEGNLAPLEIFKETGKKLLNEQVLFDVIPDDLTEKFDLEKYAAVLSFDKGGNAKLSDEVRATLSQIEAPDHVRASASVPAGGGEIDLHFVNYNRVELPRGANDRPNPGRGTADENPIPVSGIEVSFVIPEGNKVAAVEVIEPEQFEPQKMKFTVTENRVVFSLPPFLVYSVAQIKLAPLPASLKKIAGVTTVYHHNAHADVLIGRVIETDTLDGEGRQPLLKLEGLFTDQVHENDTSRELAETHKFKIYDTVAGALTKGTGNRLAVDGVMLVAEHGEYPESDTGQKLFPKRRLFGEIVETFKASKKVVPVFTDKHLADNWEDAKWLYDTAKENNIPLMAGSSLPGVWRYPAIDVRRDAKLKEIVAVNYGRLDAYGFHAMEVVQCLAERRAGGETGIKRVRTITGPEVWKSDLFDRELFQEVIDRLWLRNRLNKGKTIEELVKEPVIFVLEYNDGLRASILTLNGAVADWAAAWRYADDTEPAIESTLFWTAESRPFPNFSPLMIGIEKMFHTGIPTWPVERTLLTTGALDAVLTSKRDGGEWLDTPWLDVKYTSDHDWTQPPPPPPGRPIREQ